MDAWDIATRVLGALVGLAGLAYIVQGLRAPRGSGDRSGKPLQGLWLILMVGSNVLPERLATVRDAMVVLGCLLFLGMLLFRRRPAVT